MNAWVFLLVPATLGVDYGWERKPDGTIEYVIQIEPEAVESMKTGTELISDLPPQLRNIRTYKIKVGRDRLPNHNQLPPELLGQAPTQPNVAGGNLAGGNVAGYNPGANSGFVNNSTLPAYGAAATGTGYAAQPQYGAPTYGQPQPGTVASSPQQPTYAAAPNVNSGYAATSPSNPTFNAAGQPYNTAGTGYNSTPSYAAAQPPTQYFDAQGRPISYSGGTPTLPTGAAPNYGVSTSGFPLQSNAAGNYGQNYANPNYANPNYGNTNYAGQATYNPATGQMINPATGLPVGQYQQAGQYQQPGQYQPPGQYQQPGQYQPPTNPYGVPTTAYAEGPRFPDPRYDGGIIPTTNAKPTIEMGSGTAGTQPQQPTSPFVNTNNPAGSYAGQPYGGQYAQPTATAGAVVPVAQYGSPQSQFPGAEPRSASEGPGASIGSAVAATAEKQWLPLTMTLISLFASLGANLYFGWTTYHLRERYRMLLSDRAPSY